MLKPKKLRLYCFSPPVMLATFIIEVGLAIYVVARYGRNKITYISVSMLLCLAIFQLAEYVICTGDGAGSMQWSRAGFVAITILPALGLHMAYEVARKKADTLLSLAYINAIVWIALFGLSNLVLTGYECRANYVMFELQPFANVLYFVYYYGWLFATVFTILRFIKVAKGKALLSLRVQIWSYGAFMLPLGIINLIWPETFAGIPSIMCGFAVIFACTLAFIILPGAMAEKSGIKK